MRFGETRAARTARLENPEWTPRFAVFPVRLPDGIWAWLETVERAVVAAPTVTGEKAVYRPVGSDWVPNWWPHTAGTKLASGGRK